MIKASRRLLSSSHNYDTVIVGGGAIGASIAYHLAAKDPKHRIAVVERDLKYTKASCMLSAGGIRQQFSLKENITMSCYSAEFLKKCKDVLRTEGGEEDEVDIQFHQNGYLMLADSDSGREVLERNNKTQHECGATWLKVHDQALLTSEFPWLNTETLTAGVFSSMNEGYFDPWAYVNALKRKSKEMGGEFIEAEVTGGVLEVGANGSMEMTGLITNTNDGVIHGKTFVNAAGAWSNEFISKLNATAPKGMLSLPVEARKRCIFMFHCSDEKGAPPAKTPLTVLPDGVYFRPEGTGGRFIAGVSPQADMDPHHNSDETLDFVDHNLFEGEIWPSLATYVPAFEGIKVASAWAGFYEYNALDQNCIMDTHPDVSNLLLCTGFSGHGLQMSPAAGHAMAELIVEGKFKTMDLDNFGFARIIAHEAYTEANVI